jgi:hypothetical protein
VTGSCVLRETILGAVRGWSARFSIYLSIYLLGRIRSLRGTCVPSQATQLPLSPWRL